MGGIIVIDVDDALFDFVGGLTNYIARAHPRLMRAYRDAHTIPLSREAFQIYSLARTIPGGTLEMEEEVVGGFYTSAEFSELSPLEGAKEFAQRATAQGLGIVIATSRPAEIEALTRAQVSGLLPDARIINYHFCGGSSVSTSLTCKGQLCREYRAVAFIDDSATHIGACRRKSPTTRAFMMSQPWNKSASALDSARAHNWAYIGDELRL